MKILFRHLPLLTPLLLSACAYSVHNVYVSGFEPYSATSVGKPVNSHAEQFVILGFTTETKFVETAYEKLQEQCPRGEIVGISTEYQTAMGFFSWHNHVYMKGLCK